MRRDVVFESKGLACRGWLYVPDGLAEGERAPTIVMAHGFSAVKEMFLPAFAERFVAAGFVVLVFDYRCLGESEGEPRGQIFPHDQHEDYRNAISWAAGQPEVDPQRIGVWGTSFSGGHVMNLAAFDRRIRALVAQVPMISGWKSTVRTAGKPALQGMLGMLAADRASRYATGQVNSMKVIAPPGEPCILSTPDAYEWFQKGADKLAPTWINAVTLESLERMIEYDPTNSIELIAPTPLLIVAAEQDALIPIDSVREAFGRAGDPKDLVVLPCGHFEVYDTEPWFDRACGAALDWFKSHLA
jgi:fermentation-respiration switch protein FrsA (DUF1100 family)